MTDARARSIESIVPKSGRLLVSIDQLQALRLKQLPYGSTKVVIAFSADGNVQLGLTDQEVHTTALRDISRVPAARALARQALGNQNKKELEYALSETVASVIGPIPPERVQPTPNAVQEVRRVRVELERVTENAAVLNRVPTTDKLSADSKTFLLDQCKKVKETLKKHLGIQLTYGSAKKEDANLQRLLMDAGVSRSIYNKLITPNLVTDIQVKLDTVVFGSKISKGLRLTYEELNSPVIQDPFLGPALQLRNKFTIAVATNWAARDRMADGLDEVNLRRLARIQLTMVGPGNYSKDWANPQPAAPAGYGVVGSILLTVNQREVDFHAGIIPVGTLVSVFWTDAVVQGTAYQANARPADILAMVSEAGKTVPPKAETGYTVFPRDIALNAQMTYINKTDMGTFVRANDAKDAQIPDWQPYKVLPDFKVDFDEPKKESDLFMKSEGGKAWTSGFISKIFLKTSDDAQKAKRAGGAVSGSIPTRLFNEIKDLKLKAPIKEKLVKFLMQFQSQQMMKHAFDVFLGELQRMEMDGSWIDPDERANSDDESEHED